jgi:hypothetical protein
MTVELVNEQTPKLRVARQSAMRLSSADWRQKTSAARKARRFMTQA